MTDTLGYRPPQGHDPSFPDDLRTLRADKSRILSSALLLVGAIAWGATLPARARGQSTRALQLPLSERQPAGTSVQQSSSPIAGGGVDAISSHIQVEGPYNGSVTDHAAPQKSLTLTLQEAVARGLRANLGIIGATTASMEARSQEQQSRSALLPSVTGSLSENAAKVNLAAEGLSTQSFGLPDSFAIPSTAGPFHYYDLHGTVQQDVFDLTAIRNLQSVKESARATALDAKQAREEVVLAVASVYLQTLALLAERQQQEAEVHYAEGSYRQAKAQADAGNKAPIEANRSLVELRTEQLRLLSLRADITKQKYRLQRMIGLPLQIDVELAETLAPVAEETPALDFLVQEAWSHRLDLQASVAQLRAAIAAQKAAGAEYLPSASVAGQYGLQAINPNHGLNVFQAAASISIPIFQGGRVQADTVHADAVVAQRKAEFENMHGTVEEDVRGAYVDLQVASEQVATAKSNHELAQQNLQQSLDRFSVGVADSTEVLSSQQSLAAANHDYVNSLFLQYVARLNLAHATGETEKALNNLFKGNNR